MELLENTPAVAARARLTDPSRRVFGLKPNCVGMALGVTDELRLANADISNDGVRRDRTVVVV
jgi:hypothetical protein